RPAPSRLRPAISTAATRRAGASARCSDGASRIAPSPGPGSRRPRRTRTRRSRRSTARGWTRCAGPRARARTRRRRSTGAPRSRRRGVMPPARLAQAGAEADAALPAFGGAWLSALREVESALADYAKEIERRAALEAARGHAADAARLADARFDAGQVSYLDVLQADLVLADAEMALARSQARTAELEVALFLALGGGWTTP